VSEVAMGPINLAPLVEQPENLGGLVGQDTVHRRAARGPVGQPAAGPADHLALHPTLRQLQHPTRRPYRPALLDGSPSRSSRGQQQRACRD
jgi:hypothetical protein